MLRSGLFARLRASLEFRSSTFSVPAGNPALNHASANPQCLMKGLNPSCASLVRPFRRRRESGRAPPARGKGYRPRGHIPASPGKPGTPCLQNINQCLGILFGAQRRHLKSYPLSHFTRGRGGWSGGFGAGLAAAWGCAAGGAASAGFAAGGAGLAPAPPGGITTVSGAGLGVRWPAADSWWRNLARPPAVDLPWAE